MSGTWYTAEEWYSVEGEESCYGVDVPSEITADSTDEQLDALADREFDSLAGDGVVVLGLFVFFRAHRDKLRELDEECDVC